METSRGEELYMSSWKPVIHEFDYSGETFGARERFLILGCRCDADQLDLDTVVVIVYYHCTVALCVQCY